MTHPWFDGEPITIVVDDGGIPTEFVWQEQRHLVDKVLQKWELETDWWRAEGCIRRLYLAVFTDHRMVCVIYHDLLREEWRLLRLYD